MRVNVDDKAYADQRFVRLGARVKMNRHEALGRCLPVWNFAYQQRSEFLPADDIDAIADCRGFARAMIAAELAESKRGKLRLRGVRERIEFLLEQDAKRAMALEAKRAKALSGLPTGRPAGQHTDGKRRRKGEKHDGPGGSPAGRPYSPDQDQSPDPSPDPAPETEELAELATLAAAVRRRCGWEPPPPAVQEAERRVRTGELSRAVVVDSFADFVERGLHRTADAADRALRWITDEDPAKRARKRQRANGSRDGYDGNRDQDWETPP